ncbi:MAG: chemotaxis protein CheR [Pseudomonadota bacterium]|nr:chemotaxis protein CheR [Pseudomonadota bacterium]
MQTSLSPSLLIRLSDFFVQYSGLYFPEERWGDLERGVRDAARSSGFSDMEEGVYSLLEMPTQEKLDVFISHLTVGETCFFRDRPVFDALEQFVLPELMKEHQDTGVHIWSAGCSSGEEPYSVAILLDRLQRRTGLTPVFLQATDINPVILDKAKAGVYGEWSFRNTPAWVREGYFKPLAQGKYEILPRVRSRVSFAFGNLLNLDGLLGRESMMDLVLCRNVLMYFGPEQAKKLALKLYHLVSSGGWLVVNPVEASDELFSRFERVEFHGALFYRKKEGLKPAETRSDPVTSSTPLLDISKSTQVAKSCSVEPEARTGKMTPMALRARAREFADQGALETALVWCEKAIVSDRLDARGYYLLAMIRQETGVDEAVEEGLKQAIYLDPEYVLAYFAMGNLRLRQGRRADAKRCFRNALALLDALPGDMVLPESGDLPAGELVRIIGRIMDVLLQCD